MNILEWLDEHRIVPIEGRALELLNDHGLTAEVVAAYPILSRREGSAFLQRDAYLLTRQHLYIVKISCSQAADGRLSGMEFAVSCHPLSEVMSLRRASTFAVSHGMMFRNTFDVTLQFSAASGLEALTLPVPEEQGPPRIAYGNFCAALSAAIDPPATKAPDEEVPR